MITGGTGALGAHVARWLAAAGATHLVLTSRQGRAAAGADALEAELTELGAQVTIAACDAADRGALAALVSGLSAAGVAITSVIHAAGVAQTSAIAETGPDEVDAIAAGKIAGAIHLDEVFADTPLDAFILFSSNAGVWGGAGQGAYGAANAFLDALAEHRRASGQTAASVAWGPWAGGGMTARDDAELQLRRRGLRALAPETAIAALQQALDHGDTFVAVTDVDWDRFAVSYTAARASTLLDEQTGSPPGAARPAGSGGPGPDGAAAGQARQLTERLAGLSSAERQRLLVTWCEVRPPRCSAMRRSAKSSQVSRSGNSGSTR